MLHDVITLSTNKKPPATMLLAGEAHLANAIRCAAVLAPGVSFQAIRYDMRLTSTLSLPCQRLATLARERWRNR